MAQRTSPLVVGALMGLMMLGMVHMLLTGQSDLAAWGLVGFAALHVVVIGAALLAALFAARLSPAVRRRLNRLHRPSASHVLTMLAGAGGTALLSHLFVHGGL